jgi:GcrA cell cycle regulator
MTVLTWSDDRVEQLKKLWEAGLSASQIAAELGNVTRNAVIGKVHRLGLSGRAKSPSTAAPRQRKARPAQMVRVSRPMARHRLLRLNSTPIRSPTTMSCR